MSRSLTRGAGLEEPHRQSQAAIDTGPDDGASQPSAPFLLLLPAIIVLAAVVVVPLLLSLYSSFTPFRLTKPETFWVFIGIRNYRDRS